MVLQSSKKPEQIARENIDKMLELSGWKVKDLTEILPFDRLFIYSCDQNNIGGSNGRGNF
jgi:hypothetical protein